MLQWDSPVSEKIRANCTTDSHSEVSGWIQERTRDTEKVSPTRGCGVKLKARICCCTRHILHTHTGLLSARPGKFSIEWKFSMEKGSAGCRVPGALAVKTLSITERLVDMYMRAFALASCAEAPRRCGVKLKARTGRSKPVFWLMRDGSVLTSSVRDRVNKCSLSRGRALSLYIKTRV